MLNQVKWPPLAQKRREAWLALLYQIIQGKVVIPVDDILTPADSRTRAQNININLNIDTPVQSSIEIPSLLAPSQSGTV